MRNGFHLCFHGKETQALKDYSRPGPTGPAVLLQIGGGFNSRVPAVNHPEDASPNVTLESDRCAGGVGCGSEAEHLLGTQKGLGSKAKHRDPFKYMASPCCRELHLLNFCLQDHCQRHIHCFPYEAAALLASYPFH